MDKKYNNQPVMCYKEDAAIIKRLKRVAKLKNTNEVIHLLLKDFGNHINYEDQIKYLGVRYAGKL